MRTLALPTIFILADASQSARTVEILGTGSFHGDEVPAGARGLWFALVPRGNGAAPLLHWAGDIDGDGRLDVLLDTSDHYNVSEMRLYLSSGAKGGALVAEAAPFTSTGC